jgi:outer membrane receptor protein involved in Fe transport
MKRSVLLTRFVLIIITLSLSFTGFAQSIKLTGTVLNSKNEPVPGASISVQGTNISLAADVEGRFVISLNPGKKYVLSISSAGYNTKLVEDVEVSLQGDISISVILENKTLDQVVVRTSIKRESTSALINFQKNNSSLSSGLAADFIRRTPDKNTGEVLRRVSGASIQDNKFVIVRGLSDRYNSAMINGAQMPSSEPDKKAFSFDVIPSNLIDNIIINKTATPDLTGEFAGGLVQIQTKDIPTSNQINVGVSLGFNTQSAFKDFVSKSSAAFGLSQKISRL